MSNINIAILGFGTVGKGVYETIHTHQERLQYYFGKPVKVVAVLVKNLNKHLLPDNEVLITDKFEDIVQIKELDIVIDAIVGTEPGHTYIKRSIERGCHVITANKEMFAHYGHDLLLLAKEKNVSVGFEATVGGGIPIIQTLRKLLKVNNVTKVEGIINGTSNFILSSMREKGLPFADTLAIAKEKGYAEADPTNDIEGYDAYFKALVLSNVAFGKVPEKEEIVRKGITTITQEQIQTAESLGLRFKHVAKLDNQGSKIRCCVQPVLLTSSHPFYHVEGVQNAVSIDADIVGNISLLGPGAGKLPTASAVVEDLFHLYQEQAPTILHSKNNLEDQIEEKGQWLILNQEIDFSSLIDEIDEVKSINDQVLYISGSSEQLNLIESKYPEVDLYPFEGDFKTHFIKFSSNKGIPAFKG